MGYEITLIPGDGIGPEVMKAALMVIEECGLKINWDINMAGEEAIKHYNNPLPNFVIDSIKKNKFALKGPVTTPIGTGFRSINVTLRQELKLYSNIRPVKSYNGIKTRFSGVDLIIVRENTEDLYMGIEHMVGENAAESIKIITREASERIVRKAFQLAVSEGRKKVTAVHKANIMKCTDGLFLSCARKVAKEYNDVIFEEMIVDAMSMKLVQNPEKYDVLVMPNLYGDILSDMAAGLVGGLGVVPGANLGDNIGVFEAIHGSAPDIAGKNLANPTAAILSGAMLLKYIGEYDAAEVIESATAKVLMEGKVLTRDLGGTASTLEYTKEILNFIQE